MSDDYRPSAAVGAGDGWRLPSTLSSGTRTSSLTASSSLLAADSSTSSLAGSATLALASARLGAPPPGTRASADNAPAPPLPQAKTHELANVWSDITIARDTSEVADEGLDELDKALAVGEAPPPALLSSHAAASHPGYGSVPDTAAFQPAMPGRAVRPRVTARPANRPVAKKQSDTAPGTGRVVSTLVALGIVVKILFMVLQATGH